MNTIAIQRTRFSKKFCSDITKAATAYINTDRILVNGVADTPSTTIKGCCTTGEGTIMAGNMNTNETTSRNNGVFLLDTKILCNERLEIKADISSKIFLFEIQGICRTERTLKSLLACCTV